MKIPLFTSCCIRKLLYLDLFHHEDVHGYIQVILHDNSQQVNRSSLTLLPGKPSRLVQPARTKTQEKAVQEARALDKGIVEFPWSEPVGKFVMGFVDDACAAGKRPVGENIDFCGEKPFSWAEGLHCMSYFKLLLFDIRFYLTSQGVAK